MATYPIVYQFSFPDGDHHRYELRFDSESLLLLNPPPSPAPDWARLDHHQCPNCPLRADTHPWCPMALQLAGLVEDCSQLISYDRVAVRVATPERLIGKKTSIQQALSSLIGLIMPCSGCPQTRFFRPMARFHLPFASQQETIYRAISMYLLAQYFHPTHTVDEPLDGLREIYEQMHKVNRAFAGRLRSAIKEDASVNAIVNLDMFTQALPMVIEDKLEEVRYLFATYDTQVNKGASPATE